MALGVSRDSMSRLRKCSWYSAAVVGRPGGRSMGGVAMRRPDYPARAGAGMPRSGAHAHASGRVRATSTAATAETAATSAPVAASKNQWLPVETTTNVITAG